jgi:nucleoside-diphosphate-sugar epimerase
MLVLVTGGRGFIGQALINALVAKASIAVRWTTRDARRGDPQCHPDVIEADLSPENNWAVALTGVEVVIHTAARVPNMNHHSAEVLEAFRSVNVEGTLSLARQAAAAGVRRFIFLSSIKVNGEQTLLGHPFTAEHVANPEDAYGVSKAEAEVGLRQLSMETGMEIVIIRPPPVYGPRVKGNFSTLLRTVALGLPLPFGAATSNLRSFVGLDNLVDLILTCINHSQAANQTFLVSDNEDLSTADLLMRIGKANNRAANLIRVPVFILNFLLNVLGKRSIAQRLLGSLQLDINKTCTLLNWEPPVTVDEGLRRAVQKWL